MNKILFLIPIILIGFYLGSKTKNIAPRLYEAKAYVVYPAATATPTPKTSQIVAEIAKEFEPEGKYVIREALAVAFCESGWRTEALNKNTNGSTDHSVFQINSVHTKKRGFEFTTDWKQNIKVAYQLYKEQGWGPWVCAKKVL